MTSRSRKSLSALRLSLQTPVSSASPQAWNTAFQASNTLLQASSASLQALTAPLEARPGSLEASGSRSETSNELIQAWISVSELSDDPHRRSSASFEASNAALQASSCALEVRFPSVLVTSGTLQVRARPPPASPGTLERTAARRPTISTYSKGDHMQYPLQTRHSANGTNKRSLPFQHSVDRRFLVLTEDDHARAFERLATPGRLGPAARPQLEVCTRLPLGCIRFAPGS